MIMKTFYNICFFFIGLSFIGNAYVMYTKGRFVMAKYSVVIELESNAILFSVISLTIGLFITCYTLQSILQNR